MGQGGEQAVTGAENIFLFFRCIDDGADICGRVDGQGLEHAQDRGQGIVCTAQGADDFQTPDIIFRIDAVTVAFPFYLEKAVKLPIAQGINRYPQTFRGFLSGERTEAGGRGNLLQQIPGDADGLFRKPF